MGSLTSCISKAGKALDIDDAKDIRLRARQLVSDDKMDPAKAAVEAIQTQIDIALEDLKTIYEAAGVPFEVTETIEEPLLKSTRGAEPKKQLKAQQGRVDTPTVQETARVDAADLTGVVGMLQDEPGASKQTTLEPKSLLKKVAEKKGTAFAGLGGKPLEIYEAGTRSESTKKMSALKAAQARNRMRGAIKRDVPKKNQPEVFRLLSQASSQNEATRNAARKALEKYPKVLSEFKSMRNQIKINSIEYLQDIVSRGKPLTNRDVALVKEITKNLDTYISRQYQALSGDFKVKTQWVDRMVKAYEQYKKTGEMTDDAQIYVDALNELKNTTLNIGEYLGEQEEAGEFKAVSLDRTQAMADTWLGDNAPVRPEVGASAERISEYVEKVNRALDARYKELQEDGSYDKQLETKANRLALEILGKVDEAAMSLFAKEFTPERADLTTLKKRTKISEPIRKLLGEIVDPVVQLETTLMLQGEYLAQANRQREIYNIGKEKGWFVDKAKADDKVYTQKLTGPSFGILEGVYTTKEIYDVMKEVTAISTNWRQLVPFSRDQAKGFTYAQVLGLEALKGLRKVNSLSKAITIKYNPFNAASNFAGSALFTPLMNGYVILNPFNAKADTQDLARALAASSGQFNADERKTMNRWAEMVTSVGLGDQIQIAENQQEARAARRNEVLNGVLKERGLLGKGKDFVGNTATWLTAQSDKFWVYHAYFKELRYLTEYYKAKGMEMTPEQLQRKAAERIAETNITPERAPDFVRNLEGLGITRFMPYFTETMRSSMRSLIVAANDMREAANDAKAGQTEAARLRAARGAARFAGTMSTIVFNQYIVKSLLRLGSQVAWLAPFAGAGLLAAGLLGDEGEDDKFAKDLEAIRKGLPIDQQGKAWQVVNKRPDGTYELIEADRLVPTEPFTAVIGSILDGEYARAAAQTAGLVFANAATTTLAAEAANATGFKSVKEQPAMAKTAPDLYRTIKNAAEALASETGVDPKTASKATNFLLRVAAPFTPRPVTAVGERLASPPSEALTFMKGSGAYVLEYNPRDALANAAQYEYDIVADNQWKALKDVIATTDMTEARIQEAYLNSVRTEAEAFEKIRGAVESAKELGISDSEMTKILKDKQFNAQQIAAIKSGEFKSTLYKSSGMESSKKEAMNRAKTQSEKDAIERRFDSAKKVLDQLQNQTNF